LSVAAILGVIGTVPITPQQVQAAQTTQHAAAHDNSAQVRLVAGPGTGKSFSIEERVLWLLQQGTAPQHLAVVSFTRASSRELRDRIQRYCLQHGQQNGDQVAVSTLHSLALRMLRSAGLLHYPANPLVLDSWEVENIFDAEFGHVQNLGRTRSEAIRREHEALWSTGQRNPAGYAPPNPPINDAERNAFIAFHGPTTQTYSCVLPGEIVRQCLTQIVAGTLDPVALLHLEHLIVDEFQDLNPIDLQFVDEVIGRGVPTFVAGDDDQSIYSFRYASPAGIQNFIQHYSHAGQHTLEDCFRCTTSIAGAAHALILANPAPGRIPKNLVSLYGGAAPPVQGVIQRWRFGTAANESEAIAASCRALIQAGVPARDLLILLSNQRLQSSSITGALAAQGVQCESPQEDSFTDSEVGRFVIAMLRIVGDMHDYVAHRLILGLRRGVGIGTCNIIREAVIANQLNYRDLFYQPLPASIAGRALTALTRARAVVAVVAAWLRGDTLAQRRNEIEQIITNTFGAGGIPAWQTFVQNLPDGITLEELRDYAWAETDDQKNDLLGRVFARLNLPLPAVGVLPARVRIMTMHGAKGLSAKVVFVPGLEDEIIPGPWRQPYPALVLEAARLLYVSITRARAACILSYAQTRMVNGVFSRQHASRFAASLNGAFGARQGGLTAAEVQAIVQQVQNL
jgi:DNA helicase II / ATP-dependent DNA helicase PcrA